MGVNVWELCSNFEDYACLTYRTEEEVDISIRLRRELPRPQGPRWVPMKLTVSAIPIGKRKPRPLADFPAFLDPVFSGRSLRCFRDLLEPHGEFLPLDCDDGRECLLFNCLNFIDAFDPERSVFKCFPGSARIMDVREYHFKDTLVESQIIFRVPELGAQTFVTDAFVQRVLDCELTGFWFHRRTARGLEEILPFAPKRSPKRRKPGKSE